MKTNSVIMGLATAIVLVAGPASAGTVTISSVTVSGTAVNVSGNAT